MKSASAGCWTRRTNTMKRCGSTFSATTAWPIATQLLDLKARIEQLPLQFGKDYAVVYDSTMARFWFFNDMRAAR